MDREEVNNEDYYRQIAYLYDIMYDPRREQHCFRGKVFRGDTWRWAVKVDDLLANRRSGSSLGRSTAW